MADTENLDLPIALRRTPRRVGSAIVSQIAPPRDTTSTSTTAITKTPSKPRSKKRVRFSDPGPDFSPSDVASSPPSTGLTPMVKRSSLGEPSPKRRRCSIHARPEIDPETPDIQTSLIDRVKRRIRRVGSSDKLSAGDITKKSTPKRPNARKTRSAEEMAAAQAEVERLRAELEERDAEIERLHEATVVQDTERILELEQQVRTLRTELTQRQNSGTDNPFADLPENERDEDTSRSFYDWTLAARDPFSDTFMDEDEGFGDVTMTEAVCSTPSKRRFTNGAQPLPTSVSGSFPTPPCTSPTVPATPCSVRRAFSPATPQSHAGVQACMPDTEKEAMEAELGSLRLELTKLTDTLESNAAFQKRLSDKLGSASSVLAEAEGEDNATTLGLEKHFDTVLKTLTHRTAALLELNSSLGSLGFPGSDGSEIIASVVAHFRSARLELEYLTPGEIALPLLSCGAEVLDLLLARLRDFSRKTQEDEDTIDEYHSLELSLRQQLSARVDAMSGMRKDINEHEAALRERDDRISELEVGLDRLKGAAEGYRRDIVELENLVQRLEGNGLSNGAKVQAELDSVQTQLAERTLAVGDLETKLAATVAEAEDLRTQLQTLQRRKDAETKVRNKSNAAALALRDARVAELRREIYGVNDSLRRAHETIQKLRVANGGLEREISETEANAKVTIDALRAELEAVAAASVPKRRTRSSSRGARSMPGTGTPEPGSCFAGDLARSGAGKNRRRYDSGLGFLGEEEDELELAL
ncbi:hypothetical protein F5Y18DRAFT_187837 [Xylariaceae sp. FL1019]|nr:hypothetical protein F5Y18DRAFT_187837 [Xylariaceae sp. FL1019]